MNLLQETRVVLTLILFACIGLIATAFYMEYQLGLEPCPMCICLLYTSDAADE